MTYEYSPHIHHKNQNFFFQVSYFHLDSIIISEKKTLALQPILSTKSHLFQQRPLKKSNTCSKKCKIKLNIGLSYSYLFTAFNIAINTWIGFSNLYLPNNC